MRNDNACSSTQFDYSWEDDLRNFQREEEEESKISKAMNFNGGGGGGYFHEMYSGMLSAAIEPPQEPDKQEAVPDCPQKPSLPQNQELRQCIDMAHPPRFNKCNKIMRKVVSDANRASLTWSTVEVVEIAAGRFIQITDPMEEHRSILNEHLSLMLSHLPPDAVKSIDLVLLLLFSAEKTDQS